jgi:hypothetical protein
MRGLRSDVWNYWKLNQDVYKEIITQKLNSFAFNYQFDTLD